MNTNNRQVLDRPKVLGLIYILNISTDRVLYYHLAVKVDNTHAR